MKTSEAVNQTNSSIQLEGWSHVRETVNMLCLAICQIEATLKDSNNSVHTLTRSFAALANHSSDVATQIQKLNDPEELSAFKRDIAETADEMQTNIGASIQAFQFYDRVCQRLDHVTSSLDHVSQILDSEERITEPEEWRRVQAEIKSSYTMEAEHIMFEYVMRGGSVREALEIYRHHFEKPSSKTDEDNDEVELF